MPTAVVIPTIAPAPTILLILLPVTKLFVPVRFIFITFVGPVTFQLLKVLFCMVLIELPASIFTQPAIVIAAPLSVIFEKLLLLLLLTLPVMDEAAVVNKVTVPPEPGLLNDVTIALPLIFCTPVDCEITLFVIKFTLSIVFMFSAVKVLLFIACDKVAAVFVIKLHFPVACTA